MQRLYAAPHLPILPGLAGAPDIVLVSLGTTMGLREADVALARQIAAAGATCRVVGATMGASGSLRRRMALTDVVEGLAARRAARWVAGAVIYSSVTAALLQPARIPAAVRFDATAALNRPGPGGAWQRHRERSVLSRASLLLPWSEEAQRSALTAASPLAPPSVVLPPPVPFGSPRRTGGPDVVAYAGDPLKRGIDLLYEAWRAARPIDGRLAVAGLERGEAMRRLAKAGVSEPPGVEWMGEVPREHWLDTVASARVFVNASRHEDWGLAQMEALSAGTPLVTVPSCGANVALPLAAELAPELVAPERTAEALARALRAGLALDEPARKRYAATAERLLEPYRDEELRRRVADEVLPRLLSR